MTEEERQKLADDLNGRETNPHPGGYCTLGEKRCKWCRDRAAYEESLADCKPGS